MLKLLQISDNLPNKISYYLVMLLLAALPFDQFYSHAIFACFAAHALIHLKKERLRRLLQVNMLCLQAIFFVSIIGLTYASYSTGAITDITRQLAILLFPVFFALTSLDLSHYKENFLRFFTLVCTATLAYLYIHAFMVIGYFGRPLIDILSPAFINHNFSAPIQMHATFFSLQVALAFFYALMQVIKMQKPMYKLLYGMAAMLLCAGLMQLGAKSVLVVVLVGINIMAPYFLITRGKRIRYMLTTGTLSILLIICAVSITGLRTRFLTDLKEDLSAAKVNATTDARLPRWDAALNVIARSPVIGYGAGSELSVLGDEFYNEKLYNAYLNRLNAHNQYLSFLITSGIIGLLAYLATLFWGFRNALVQKDMMMCVFISLIATVSLSESLLNAEKGVFFYSLFFSFFIFSGQHQFIPLRFKKHKYLQTGATEASLATSSL